MHGSATKELTWEDELTTCVLFFVFNEFLFKHIISAPSNHAWNPPPTRYLWISIGHPERKVQVDEASIVCRPISQEPTRVGRRLGKSNPETEQSALKGLKHLSWT